MTRLLAQEPLAAGARVSASLKAWLEHPVRNPLHAAGRAPEEAGGLADILAQKAGERALSMDAGARLALVQALERQYLLSGLHALPSGIKALLDPCTVVVTTAHQPNWMGGPAYWLHKMCSTVSLARNLNQMVPEYKWIPVYWMGSEDHDLAELAHCYVGGLRLEWPGLQGPLVREDRPLAFGRVPVHGGANQAGGEGDYKALELLEHELEALLGEAPFARECMELWRKAWRDGVSVADAARRAAHALLGEGGWLFQGLAADKEGKAGGTVQGLLVVDGDDAGLKEQVAWLWEDQRSHPGLAASLVRQASGELREKEGIEADLKVREQPYFILDGLHRLRPEEGSAPEGESSYGPGQFSPGVALRPLYQEAVLPNVVTVGGGAEVLYWTLLQPLFEQYKVAFPALMLRPSLAWLDAGQWTEWTGLGRGTEDLKVASEALSRQDLQRLAALHGLRWTELEALDPAGTEENALSSAWQSLLGPLERAMLEADPGLSSAWGAGLHRIHSEVERMVQLHHKALRRRFKEELSKAQALDQHLNPGGRPMERREGMWLPLAQGGPALLLRYLDWLNPLDHDRSTAAPWYRWVVLP